MWHWRAGFWIKVLGGKFHWSIEVVDFGRQLLAREVRDMAARWVCRAPDGFPMVLEAGKRRQMFRLVTCIASSGWQVSLSFAWLRYSRVRTFFRRTGEKPHAETWWDVVGFLDGAFLGNKHRHIEIQYQSYNLIYIYIWSPPLPGPTCRRGCITYVSSSSSFNLWHMQKPL